MYMSKPGRPHVDNNLNIPPNPDYDVAYMATRSQPKETKKARKRQWPRGPGASLGTIMISGFGTILLVFGGKCDFQIF